MYWLKRNKGFILFQVPTAYNQLPVGGALILGNQRLRTSTFSFHDNCIINSIGEKGILLSNFS